MNETLDLPLFDLCDGRPSASQRLGGGGGGGRDVDIGHWTVDRVADACGMRSRAG